MLSEIVAKASQTTIDRRQAINREATKAEISRAQRRFVAAKNPELKFYDLTIN